MAWGKQAYDYDGAGRPYLSPTAEDAVERFKAALALNPAFIAEVLVEALVGQTQEQDDALVAAITTGDADALLATVKQAIAARVEEAFDRQRGDSHDAMSRLAALYDVEA